MGRPSDDSSHSRKSHTGLIVGLTFAAILMVLVVGLVFMYYRRSECAGNIHLFDCVY